VSKRFPSIPKNRPYKKTVQCLATVLVALRSAVCRRCPKCRRAYKKTVECPVTVLVALGITVRRAKLRITRLCCLLMNANIGKHGTGCKPCDARQHFIQNDHIANKMQRFVRCVHCTNAFEKVFMVLVRPSMCEGKRTPWSHTCVNASSTKCRTCRCLIQSPAPLKLNILGLGRRLRRTRQPTTTTPSEHANNQSSIIVRLLFWTKKRSNFIASYWSSKPKPTFPSRLSADRAFGASSSFAMRKPQKRYLPANFWEAQSWTSTQIRWT